MNRIHKIPPSIALFLVLAQTVLANGTWYVNGATGSDTNNCKSPTIACKTIGHAISLASTGDSIVVAPATYPENITISFSLNLIGSGASTTIIDGGGSGRVVTIPNYGLFTLSDITIRNGYAPWGAGIYNNGRLTINNSTISGNLAFVRLGYSYGGGIYNNTNGVLTINNSTLNANTAGCGSIGCAGYGAGIYNIGGVLLNNSTINGNVAYAHYRCSEGGGIATSGIVSINNSTFSGNVACHGGGIFGGSVFQNSIVANSGGGNCVGNMSSKGYNLSSDGTCAFNSPGDLNNHDPLLGPLQNNGGPTQTMAILPGSPAIDAGNPAGCTDAQGNLLRTDQRGMPRPDSGDSGGCDIGAYESQSQ